MPKPTYHEKLCNNYLPLSFTISEVFAVGIDNKMMALRTNLSKLNTINNIREMSVGLNEEAYMSTNKMADIDKDYIQRIQRMSLLFAAIGYNPYGWMEFGLMFNLGKSN